MSGIRRREPFSLSSVPNHLLVHVLTKLSEHKSLFRLRRTCSLLNNYIEENRERITIATRRSFRVNINGALAPKIFNHRFYTITEEQKKEIQRLIVRDIELSGERHVNFGNFDWETLLEIMKTWIFIECDMKISSFGILNEEQFLTIMEMAQPIKLSIETVKLEKILRTQKTFESVKTLFPSGHQNLDYFPNVKTISMYGRDYLVEVWGSHSTLDKVQDYFKNWQNGRYNFESFDLTCSFPSKKIQEIRGDFARGLDLKTFKDEELFKKIHGHSPRYAFYNELKPIPFHLMYRESDDRWAYLCVFEHGIGYDWDEGRPINIRQGILFKMLPKEANEDCKAAIPQPLENDPKGTIPRRQNTQRMYY